MAEQPPRSKASDVADQIMRHVPREGRKLPEARLRHDAPTLEVDKATPMREALDLLRTTDIGAIALSEAGGEPSAVVMPVERYLELAAKDLLTRRNGTIASNGRIVPQESALADLYIEPVDPQAEWRWP